jgi:hypothetical protein
MLSIAALCVVVVVVQRLVLDFFLIESSKLSDDNEGKH